MFDLVHIFSYHAPSPQQIPRYEAIRGAAREFAEVVLANTSEGGDQTAALRHIREAAWTANASVALDARLRVNESPVDECSSRRDPWTSDLPLRKDATDAQIIHRTNYHVKVRNLRGMLGINAHLASTIAVARELVAAQ